LWQTDELRVARPEVMDDASNAVYYFHALHSHTLEALTEELVRLGVDVPADARRLSFGRWIGGDRDGNPHVTAETTLKVLALQHDHAIRDALDLVDELRDELASSVRVAGVAAELESSLGVDLEQLRELDPRYRRLNSEEPYRPKLTCIREKLLNTASRVVERRPHEPGRDYLGTGELLADLVLVRDSLLAHRGELIARGWLERAVRTLGPSIFHLATLECASTQTPTTTQSASCSTASTNSPDGTRSCRETSGATCSPASCARGGQLPPPRRRSRRRRPGPTARSPPSAMRSTGTAPR